MTAHESQLYVSVRVCVEVQLGCVCLYGFYFDEIL